MLQSVGLQREGHDLMTEQQKLWSGPVDVADNKEGMIYLWGAELRPPPRC